MRVYQDSALVVVVIEEEGRVALFFHGMVGSLSRRMLLLYKRLSNCSELWHGVYGFTLVSFALSPAVLASSDSAIVLLR